MTLPAMAPRFPELQDAGWLRRRYEVEGLSSYAIAVELGCRANSVSRALRRHGITARMRRPAVGRGQVYGRLTCSASCPSGTVAAASFAAAAPAGARPTRARSNCGKERSAPAAVCSTRQGRAATRGRRACTAGNATDGSSSCTRQGVRAQATPGVSAVAATVAARRRFAGPTSPAATPAHADACSRSTTSAAAGRAQPLSVPAETRAC
jgi:hypothetical protein